MKKATQALCALGLSAVLSAALLWYYDTFVHWQPKLYPFAMAVVTAVFAAFTLFVLWVRGERRGKALMRKTVLSVAVFTGMILCAVSFIINNVMYGGTKPGPQRAAAAAMLLAGVQIIVLLVLLTRARRKPLLGACMAVVMLLPVFLSMGAPYFMKSIAKVPPGLNEGRFAPMPALGEADFTVPSDGSIEEIRDIIRDLRANGEDKHFTVLIGDGEYNITQILLDERDRDTTWRSWDGGVILNGGISLNPKDFAPVNGEAASRLSPEARENVVQIDLKKLGLTAEDWGKMYAFGGFSTASKYDGGVGPLPSELFYNGKRCVTARYPNGDAWLKIGEVIDNGDSSETYEGGTVRHAEWADMRNPRGGTFVMDKATAARAASWAAIGDVWMFGCFKWDWADMSTPVKAIDSGAGTITTEYASMYGFKNGGTYYFYNVLEELDAPGEWYLDRDAGLLYLWPPKEDMPLEEARIDLSLSTETLIEGKDLENISFIGLTLQGTRGDGIRLSGNDITVDHCVVRNIAGSAVTLDGYRNTASNNEIYRVGRQGISISGGDQATLTPGSSKAVNNLVHDWPEVVMTYQGGVNIHGTGNLAAHNELYNSPHSAMFIGGNNNVIEYNLIHDVCLITDDAGAIYGGRSLYDAQGTVIRYNALYNIGGGGHTPCGIYLDDGLSGVTVEKNLLVNVPDSAIAVSGRDLEIHGNVVVNAGKPISYDQRTRDGALATDPNFWFYAHTGPGGNMWTALESSPWQTDIWREAYPKLAALSTDFADIESPVFAANPAGSSVTGNVFVGTNKPRYAESVIRFSTIENNTHNVYLRSRSYWTLPEYADIPIEQIGRVG
ncbi:MAG: right-handed parallel beta-helix repeat-containing protein [Oscillospiraceae bacterium]|nr:right-handed parallel beta-helix repeat-containing protein [Oscillospiraceae bacterium]